MPLPTGPDPYALAEEAAQAVRQRFGIERLDLVFTLGSGWAAASEDLGEEIGSCPIGELPGFSAPVVIGHGGQFRVVRTAAGKTAAVLTGRTHYYEGRGVAPVVHGVRTAIKAGASTVVLTNGCGGLDPERGPGTVVVLRDHLNLTGANPLVGARFIDMTEGYSTRLRAIAHRVDETLTEGVYAQFHGPSFETPAEVRMAGVLGADLVGMSTGLETIAARELGAEVLGLSLVTNLAAGISPTPLHHLEVIEAGEAAGPRLRRLLADLAAAL